MLLLISVLLTSSSASMSNAGQQGVPKSKRFLLYEWRADPWNCILQLPMTFQLRQIVLVFRLLERDYRHGSRSAVNLLVWYPYNKPPNPKNALNLISRSGLLSSYSDFFYLLIAANFRRSRSFFASIQAIPFLSPTILCFRPRKSIIGFVYLSLKKSVPFVLPIMHFYKTLLQHAE